MIDSTAPETTATLSPSAPDGNNGWYKSDVEVALSAVDNLDPLAITGIEETYLDGNVYSSAVTYSTEGTTTVSYFSYDKETDGGPNNEPRPNFEDPKTTTFKIDKTAPDTVATLTGTLDASGFYTSDVTVDLVATDPGALSGVDSITVNGTGYTTPAQLVFSGSGTHTIDFFATDMAGNTEVVETKVIKIDEDAPTTTHALAGTVGANGWYTSPVDVTLTAVDSPNPDGAGVAGTLLDSNVYSAAVTYNVEGINNIRYASIDNAGNAETDVDVTFNIDTVAPVTSGARSGTVGNAGWYISPVDVSLTAADATSGVAGITLDGAPYTTVRQYTAQGLTTTNFFATDNAGNIEAATVDSFNIDTVAPVTTSTYSGTAGNNGWYTSPVTVNLSVVEATSGLNATALDGAAYGGATVYTAEGTTTINFASDDVAGNVEPTNTETINIDTVDPVSTVSVNGTLGTGGWYTGPVTVSVTANDATSGANQAYIDGVAQASNTYQGSGLITVGYYADDVAGNTEAERFVQFKIDGAKPSIGITDSGRQCEWYPHWYNGPVTVSIAASDAESGLNDLTVDGRVLAGNWTQTFSTDGAHTISDIAAHDTAGNRKTRSDRTYNIDTKSPTFDISVSTDDNGITINVDASDDGSGIRGWTTELLNESGQVLQSWPSRTSQYWDAGGLTEGTFTARVRGNDNACLAGEASTEIGWNTGLFGRNVIKDLPTPTPTITPTPTPTAIIPPTITPTAFPTLLPTSTPLAVIEPTQAGSVLGSLFATNTPVPTTTPTTAALAVAEIGNPTPVPTALDTALNTLVLPTPALGIENNFGKRITIAIPKIAPIKAGIPGVGFARNFWPAALATAGGLGTMRLLGAKRSRRANGAMRRWRKRKHAGRPKTGKRGIGKRGKGRRGTRQKNGLMGLFKRYPQLVGAYMRTGFGRVEPRMWLYSLLMSGALGSSMLLSQPVNASIAPMNVPLRTQDPDSVYCGAATLGMAMEYYKTQGSEKPVPSSKQLIDWMNSKNLFYEFGTGVEELAYAARENGFKGSYFFHEWTPEKLQAELKAGRPVNIPVKMPEYAQSEGHFLTVTGMNKTGTAYIVNDPLKGQVAIPKAELEANWKANGASGVVVMPEPKPAVPASTLPLFGGVGATVALAALAAQGTNRKGLGAGWRSRYRRRRYTPRRRSYRPAPRPRPRPAPRRVYHRPAPRPAPRPRPRPAPRRVYHRPAPRPAPRPRPRPAPRRVYHRPAPRPRPRPRPAPRPRRTVTRRRHVYRAPLRRRPVSRVRTSYKPPTRRRVSTSTRRTYGYKPPVRKSIARHRKAAPKPRFRPVSYRPRATSAKARMSRPKTAAARKAAVSRIQASIRKAPIRSLFKRASTRVTRYASKFGIGSKRKTVNKKRNTRTQNNYRKSLLRRAARGVVTGIVRVSGRMRKNPFINKLANTKGGKRLTTAVSKSKVGKRVSAVVAPYRRLVSSKKRKTTIASRLKAFRAKAKTVRTSVRKNGIRKSIRSAGNVVRKRVSSRGNRIATALRSSKVAKRVINRAKTAANSRVGKSVSRLASRLKASKAGKRLVSVVRGPRNLLKRAVISTRKNGVRKTVRKSVTTAALLGAVAGRQLGRTIRNRSKTTRTNRKSLGNGLHALLAKTKRLQKLGGVNVKTRRSAANPNSSGARSGSRGPKQDYDNDVKGVGRAPRQGKFKFGVYSAGGPKSAKDLREPPNEGQVEAVQGNASERPWTSRIPFVKRNPTSPPGRPWTSRIPFVKRNPRPLGRPWTSEMPFVKGEHEAVEKQKRDRATQKSIKYHMLSGGITTGVAALGAAAYGVYKARPKITSTSYIDSNNQRIRQLEVSTKRIQGAELHRRSFSLQSRGRGSQGRGVGFDLRTSTRNTNNRTSTYSNVNIDYGRNRHSNQRSLSWEAVNKQRNGYISSYSEMIRSPLRSKQETIPITSYNTESVTRTGSKVHSSKRTNGLVANLIYNDNRIDPSTGNRRYGVDDASLGLESLRHQSIIGMEGKKPSFAVNSPHVSRTGRAHVALQAMNLAVNNPLMKRIAPGFVARNKKLLNRIDIADQGLSLVSDVSDARVAIKAMRAGGEALENARTVMNVSNEFKAYGIRNPIKQFGAVAKNAKSHMGNLWNTSKSVGGKFGSVVRTAFGPKPNGVGAVSNIIAKASRGGTKILPNVNKVVGIAAKVGKVTKVAAKVAGPALGIVTGGVDVYQSIKTYSSGKNENGEPLTKEESVVNATKGVAGAVTLVGSALMLTPAAPVGAVLVAAGTIVSLGATVYENREAIAEGAKNLFGKAKNWFSND